MIIAGLLGMTLAVANPLIAFTAKSPHRGKAQVYVCSINGRDVRVIEGPFIGDCRGIHWVGSERVVWFAESKDKSQAEVWTATLTSLKPVRIATGRNLTLPSPAMPGPFNFAIQIGGPMSPIRFASIDGNGKLIEPIKWRTTWLDLASTGKNEVIEADSSIGKRKLRFTPGHGNPISIDNPMGKPTAVVFADPIVACIWDRSRNTVTVTTASRNERYSVFSIDFERGQPKPLVSGANAIDFRPGAAIAWADGNKIHFQQNSIQPTPNPVISLAVRR
jgi:hypothetical protein